MDKIKTVKIKNPDGSVSQETYTIAVDAKNVDMNNGKDVQDTIGNIDVDNDGNINQQLRGIKNTLSFKANSADIPTAVSQLQNDSGYLIENNLENMINQIQIKNSWVSVNNATGNANIDIIYGKMTQELDPTPIFPKTINVVTGDIKIKINKDTQEKEYKIPLGNLELCGVNNNKDYLYKENGKWYIYKIFGKTILNGKEPWYRYNGNLYIETITNYKRSNNIPICTHYQGAAMTPGTIQPTEANNNTIRFGNNASLLNRLFIMDSLFTTSADFKEWLSLNPITVYYLLKDPEIVPILDETLINKLNNFLELYQGNNSIRVDSNNLIPEIDISYAITNRDFYSKEETKNLINLKKEEELKFHAVAKSSATYIVQFPNGKNMLVDTGQAIQWTDIKNAIDGLGITKFDYFILTHFHSDHIGNVQNICDTYDLSDCKCWVGMKPDFTNHASEIGESTTSYDNTITLLKNNGLDPQVPIHDSFFGIDEGISLHFLNTSTEIAENYYGRIIEYRTEKILNFNHFSLVTELDFHGKIITFTGDIERPCEEYLNSYIRKADIITSPHHGVNIAAYRPFYENIKPIYSLNMYISDVNTWIHPFYNSFMTQKELGAHMITPDCTEAINGLFSFNIKKSYIHFLNNGDEVVAPGRDAPVIYTQISQIFDRSTTLAAELTLEQLFNEMVPCSSLQVYFWGSYQTGYETLYNDIKTIFPTFTTGMIKLYKDVNHYKEIVVNNPTSSLTLKATSIYENYNMVTRFSNGIIPNVNNTSALIEELKKYPVGHYVMDAFYEHEDNSVLVGNGAYQLNISIVVKDGNNIWANITAFLRNTQQTSTDVCRVASCYINTTNTPQYNWLKLN